MRTSARFRRALVISVVIAPASCSLITSLDTLHGGDDATTDAITPPIDGANTDADAGSVADSGFCATQLGVVFCDDFDTPDAVAFSRWTSVVESIGGSASLVTADASLPFAAHFHTPAYDAGVSPQAALTETFLTSATTSIRYTFDVRVDHYPTGGTMSFSPIKPSADAGGQLYLSLNSQSAAFSELITFMDGGSYFNGWTLTQRPTPNVWTHVEIDLQGGNPMTASVYLNNQLVVPQNTVIDDRITFGVPDVVAGITYESPSGDVSIVDVDNVVIDFH